MDGPFGIAFEPLYYAATFGPGFLVPTVSLDHLTLSNGEVANLTVTIPADAPPQSFAPFEIRSGRYDGDQNGGYYAFLDSTSPRPEAEGPQLRRSSVYRGPRSSSAWRAATFTLGKSFSILPSAPMMAVVRMAPMIFLPYMFFSPQAP
jgi:hypothetical protein